ncbi:MAG TPA: multiheme c-type cytochrome, partial [Candidatus Udaeobacter sp.]|nr:multiheme c-type cytochrome [Candidatus Udaeobacter sp.]
MKSRRWWLVAVGLAVVIGGWFLARTRQSGGPEHHAAPNRGPSEVAAGYVGRETCATCHQAEAERWRGSDHDLAMQVADEHTMLGNFEGEGAKQKHYGVTSTFSKRGNRYHVETDGPDGKLHTYPIAYTFGVRPLQQYLIEFPGGRYQALSVSWDSRPAAEGGQRWFHLYPNERVPAGDELHWTGSQQNWNFMCAECHSTALEKHYDPTADRYATTWSEINVSCEACHGPGSAHVEWAKAHAAGGAGTPADPTKGLRVLLREDAPVEWSFAPKAEIAHRAPPSAFRAEVETCARCHARRALLTENYVHGHPILDTHRITLLDDPLYYDDGQIRGEVYEYGSFLQ